MGGVMDCDYDPPEFYHASQHRAAKRYQCAECGCAIVPGARYENVFGKWCGHVDTFKTCANCVDLRQWVKNNVACLCWSHGNTLEDLDNAVEDACARAREETKGLKFGYLRRKLPIIRYFRARRVAA
jgi:hypothetical protein